VPKTATTTLQHGLWLNRDWLAQRGYYLPQTGSVRGITPVNIFAHHNLAREVNLRDRPHNPSAGTLAALINEVESQPLDQIIVSSEVLSFSHRLTPQHVTWLRSQLPQQWDIQVIVYIRRQDELLHSWWAQVAKLGRTQATFAQMLPRLMRDYRAADYDRLLQYWEDPFGRENIHLRVFEDIVKQGHIFADLLAWYGLTDLDGAVMPQSTNTTPSEKTLRFIRKVSQQLQTPGEADDTPDMGDIGADASDWQLASARYYQNVLLVFAAQAGWNETKVNQLTPALRQHIMGHYAQSNQRVARRYFGRDDLFVGTFAQRPVTTDDAPDYAPADLEALVVQSARSHINLELERVQLQKRHRTTKAKLRQAQRRDAPKQLQKNTAPAKMPDETLLRRMAALEQELALRRSMPLARASELLYAAQREWQQGGPSGFAKRLTAWLRGERRRQPPPDAKATTPNGRNS
jgi:hypothetical protein